MTSLACPLLMTLAIAGSYPAQRAGSLAWVSDNTTLAVANLEATSVTLVATEPPAKLTEITLEDHPRSIAASPDPRILLVSLPAVDKIVWLDTERQRAVRSLVLPGGPVAMVSHPSSGVLYVATQYNNRITEVDARTARVVRYLPVPPAPRGLTLSPDGTRLYVVHFFSGQVSVVDTDQWTVLATITNRPDANLARALALSPEGDRAYLPHIRSNVTNQRLLFDTTVFPVVSVFDLHARKDIAPSRIALDAIGRPANNPWDAVVSDDGRRLYVVNAGSDDLQVLDLGTGQSLAQIDVGQNPRSIVLAPDGQHAFVHNAVSNDLSVIDTVHLIETHRISLTSHHLPPAIQCGQMLFHSARPRSMSLDSWISCASCHPDGESDGRTWRFAAGPRKTPSLHGAGDTLPHNRLPDRDEIQDTEGFIRQIMGGTGLIPGNRAPPKLGAPCAARSADADALAAYVASLRPRRSPFAAGDAEQMAAIERGSRIFFSEQTGCGSCHPPPFYTDSQLARPWKLHDVGTGDTYDTPSLLGLYAAPSYLHDGRAKDLQEVLITHNAHDRHGRTSHLNGQEIQDLVAFLLALPTTDRRMPLK